MKKMIPLAAVLAATLSFGTNMALADGGGETGADAAHTQPYWQPDDGSNFYMEEQGAASQRVAPLHRSRRTFEER
jgi:hypothetical protein